MIFKDISILLLMSSLSVVVGQSVNQSLHSQDFCEVFGYNNFEIDYGYYNVMNDRFLFIGQLYWRLTNKWIRREGQKDASLELQFESNYSKMSNEWFGSQYSIAFEIGFCGYIGIAKVCKLMTGTMDENIRNGRNVIDWAPIDFDYNSRNLSKSDDYDRYIVNKTEISFDSDFVPTIGFQWVGHYTCFVHQKESGAEYYRNYRCFRFDPQTGNASDVTNGVKWALKREMMRSKLTTELDEVILNELSDTRKLIAIFYDFHLFVEKQVITYCPSHSFFFNLGCKEEPRVLIDCSHRSKTKP